MFNFSKSKNKKIIIFAFLFFVLLIGFSPKIALADCSSGMSWLNCLSLGTFDWPSTEELKAAYKSELDVLGSVGSPFANALLWVATIIPLATSAALSDLAGTLLKWIVAVTAGGNISYTNSTAVQYGWPLMRDLANMLIVLGFVVIGMAFTLRLENYGSKKALINLIIVALLINFSLVLCGGVIDGSNIAMNNFLGKAGDGLASYFSLNSTKVVAEITKSITTNDPLTFLTKATGAIIFNFVATAVFLLFVFLFLFRVMMLWILVILSPLAFVCYPFNYTKKFFDTWLNNFIQWCFIGIPGALFLWLGTKMGADMSGSMQSLNTTQAFTNLASFLVPAAFLVAGFMMSIQMGGAASGLVKWAGGKAKTAGYGAASATAKLSDKASGGRLSAAGSKIKNTYGQTLEKIGLRDRGVTEAGQNKRLNDAKTRLYNIKNDEDLVKLAEGKATTSKQKLNKAAATVILAENKKFDKIDPRKREAATAHAVAFGASKDVFAKAGPGVGVGSTNKEVMEEARHHEAKNLSAKVGMSYQEAQKTIPQNWKPNDNETIEAKKRLEIKKSTENSLGLSSATDKDVFNDIVFKKQQEYVDLGHTWEAARNMTSSMKQSEMGRQIQEAKEGYSQNKVRGAIQKLSPSKAAELSGNAVNDDTIGAFNAKQLQEMMKKGSGELLEKVEEYKNSVTKGTSEYNAVKTKIMSLPKGPERDALIAKHLELKRKFNV